MNYQYHQNSYKMPNKPSVDKPVMLTEIYRDVAIEYGVRFIKHNVSGLLIRARSVKHEENYYVHDLTEGGFCIYTNKHSDTRLFMPSPNVSLTPLTLKLFTSTIKFKSMAQALNYSKILSELGEVSLDIYVHLWKLVGAHIGRKMYNKIEWEKHAFTVN